MPLYARVSYALAVALLVATLGGVYAGVERYLDARDHRVEAQRHALLLAETLAEAVGKEGRNGAARAALDASGEAVGAVQVVRSGGVDEFGIARGDEVAWSDVRDEAARPADAKAFAEALLVRSAELADYLGKGEDIPQDRRFERFESRGRSVVAAYAPILDRDHRYLGFVRVAQVPAPFVPSVPSWLLALGVLLASALAFGATFGPPALGGAAWEAEGRLGSALWVAVGVGTVAWGGGATTLLALVALAGALGAGGVGGVARVFRGVREQPGTYVYIAPAMIAMIVLVFVPFAMGIALAFFDGGSFTGLENFHEILVPDETVHPTFYWTLGMTILWTVSNVVLHVSIGVALALVLNRPSLRFRWLYRVLLIVPWAVPNYITALIWKTMFNTDYGAVNAFLATFGVDKVDWLGTGSSLTSNFIANLVTNTWLGFPFMMVVTLGALQSIPAPLYEAAEIDGARRWQMFRHVTLPLLKPALIPAIILGVIWTFNMFNVIYLVSGGAPDNETNILITQAYYAFKVLKRFGFAAAYSLLIFVILLAYGWMQNRVTRATEGAFE